MGDSAGGSREHGHRALHARADCPAPPLPPGWVELAELLKLVPGEPYPGQTGRWLQTSSIFKRVWEAPLEEA